MANVKRRRGRPAIHARVREALGYDASQTDDEVYRDWKERTSRVCKPCWELKYCPYGPLVEQSPLLPVERTDAEEHIAYLRECLENGVVGQVTPLTEESREMYEEWSRDEKLLLQQGLREIQKRSMLEAAEKLETVDEQISEFSGHELPPIHKYRVSYNIGDDDDLDEDHFPPETWSEIKRVAEKNRGKYLKALDDGKIDNRAPLDAVRRAWFEKEVKEFSPDDHPNEIPPIFIEGACNVFGHICPVFFAAEALTETTEERRIGRRQLSFKTMMRIVRRDDYRCQHCQKKLRDNEVEFDHIIPISKGGSSEEHNLRLTCFDCNRDKSDSYSP